MNYDKYCNIVHTQPQELSDEFEEFYHLWYDENERNIKNMKDNGYTEEAILKKAFIFGFRCGKNE